MHNMRGWMNLKGLELRSCLEKGYTSSHKHPTIPMQQNTTENVGKKVSSESICHNFFSAWRFFSKGHSIKLTLQLRWKLHFRRVMFHVVLRWLHCRGFPVCVPGCLEVSVEKISGINMLFRGYVKEIIVKLCFKQHNLGFHQKT